MALASGAFGVMVAILIRGGRLGEALEAVKEPLRRPAQLTLIYG